MILRRGTASAPAASLVSETASGHAQGYVEAAQIFERESRTTPDVDLGAITDRTDIRKAVQEGDLETAIARVNDLSPEVSPY